MPVRQIVIENPTAYEAVDVTNSANLKELHRRFGVWMKKLASIVKKYYAGQKGRWQALWTIATNVFRLAYHGWSVDTCVHLATDLAKNMGIDEGLAEEMAREIYVNMNKIIGERRARPTEAEVI